MADLVYTKLDNLTLPVDYCQIILRRPTKTPLEMDNAAFKKYDYAVGMIRRDGPHSLVFIGGSDDGQFCRVKREDLPAVFEEYAYIGGMGDQA